MFIKVQDRRDIIRDGDSKAILNINNDGLAAYKAKRQREQTMDNIVNEVSNLKADMGEIKLLLSRILEKNNDN